MYRILSDVISVRDLTMLLANVSTTSFVPDAQRLAIKMTHALKLSNVLTAMKTMHRIIKNAVSINVNMIFNILEYRRIFLFSKLVRFIKKNSWTESDELCWRRKGSDPERIIMYTD